MWRGPLAYGQATAQADRVYGYQLMTPEERTAYQEKMRAATTWEERQKIRDEHRALMDQRAKEKGVTLAEPRGPRSRRLPRAGNRRHLGHRWRLTRLAAHPAAVRDVPGRGGDLGRRAARIAALPAVRGNRAGALAVPRGVLGAAVVGPALDPVDGPPLRSAGAAPQPERLVRDFGLTHWGHLPGFHRRPPADTARVPRRAALRQGLSDPIPPPSGTSRGSARLRPARRRRPRGGVRR